MNAVSRMFYSHKGQEINVKYLRKVRIFMVRINKKNNANYEIQL